jgi:hypothetical protein
MKTPSFHLPFLFLRKHLFFVCLIALTLSTLLIFSFNTIAQNVDSQQSIELSPPSQEISTDPGKKTQISVTVRNTSDRTLPIKVRVENFTANGEEGQIALSEEDKNSISSWTKIAPQSFSLAPGESQDVTATVSVPKTGIAGGQYGSLIFSVTGSKEQNAAAVSQEVASLFLLRISGDIDEHLTLLSMSAKPFSEYGPVPMTMKFENTGNVHVKPYGLINITDMFGQRVTDIVVPGQNVLPGSIRNVTASLDRKFLIGKYKALAVMYYGTSKNHTLTAETTFIVIPYKIILILAGVLTLMYMMRKRLKKVMKALGGK